MNTKTEKVINDPLHGNEFYTEEMKEKLQEKVDVILTELGIKDNPDLSDYTKIELINNYMRDNVSLNKEYFDALNEIAEFKKEQTKYRTAYAALVEGEGICVAFTEGTRVLLENAGVETESHMAMLPDNRDGKEAFKPCFHYLSIAKCKDAKGNVTDIVLDPERQKSREKKEAEEKKVGKVNKGTPFHEYMDTIRVLTEPPQEFLDNKLGSNGLGTPYYEIPPEHIHSKSVKEIGYVITDPEFQDKLLGSNTKNIARRGDVALEKANASEAAEILKQENTIEKNNEDKDKEEEK